MYGGKKKKGRMKCEEGFSSYVWRGVHGRKLCVASTYSKTSGFLVRLVVPPKSIVAFVSNFNQF